MHTHTITQGMNLKDMFDIVDDLYCSEKILSSCCFMFQYLAERRSTVTDSLQTIILTYFQKEYQERLQIHEEELNELAKMGQDNQHEIPVFVCTLGFPTVLCPLHIFEPRYRLMIRQCMEAGTRQFGMCTCLSDNE